MSLLNDYNVSRDSTFIAKVRMAIISTALAVQSEATNTANHVQRSSFAILVLANPDGYSTLMAPGFTVDGNADNSTSDSALESRASAIWNAYAVQG